MQFACFKFCIEPRLAAVAEWSEADITGKVDALLDKIVATVERLSGTLAEQPLTGFLLDAFGDRYHNAIIRATIKADATLSAAIPHESEVVWIKKHKRHYAEHGVVWAEGHLQKLSQEDGNIFYDKLPLRCKSVIYFWDKKHPFTGEGGVEEAINVSLQHVWLALVRWWLPTLFLRVAC
jgi:hypothetical protein